MGQPFANGDFLAVTGITTNDSVKLPFLFLPCRATSRTRVPQRQVFGVRARVRFIISHRENEYLSLSLFLSRLSVMRLKVSQTELLFKHDARFDVTLKIILVSSVSICISSSLRIDLRLHYIYLNLQSSQFNVNRDGINLELENSISYLYQQVAM